MIYYIIMTFISFIYKIIGDNTRYYGKYCFHYISDDHEGLDLEVKTILKCGLNSHRVKNGLPKLKSKDICIGVLSFSRNEYIPTYSTEEEIKCFDFYCLSYNNETIKYYIGGVLQ
jgi:hypothetical protein